jgi:hypothetical protein
MKTLKIYETSRGKLAIKISYPHWHSGKQTEQIFTFYNDEKGIKSMKNSLNKFIKNGYKIAN